VVHPVFPSKMTTIKMAKMGVKIDIWKIDGKLFEIKNRKKKSC
jgi:hypothetical protein